MDKLEKTTINCELFTLKGKTFKCKIVKCYDGDTVHAVFKFDDKFQRFRIRLLGIDSAEIRTKDKTQKELAIKAKNRITELILNKIVYVECDKFDSFGRVLGVIRINKNDSKSINDIMLEEGYCDVY